MNRSANSRSAFSRVVLATIAASLASFHFAIAAQAPVTAKNPPRRLPPTGSQSSDIPAGVDTGSPATSNAMPLGTPVPPALLPDRDDQNKRSAAARLASRPIAPARASSSVPAGPATLGVQTDSRDQTATLPSSQRPVARRSGVAARDCNAGAKIDAPVALPQSGFTGSSASPATATATAVARGPSSRPCP